MDYLTKYLSKQAGEPAAPPPPAPGMTPPPAAPTKTEPYAPVDESGINRYDIAAGAGVGLLSALVTYLFTGSARGATGVGLLGTMLGVVGRRLGWDQGQIGKYMDKYGPMANDVVKKQYDSLSGNKAVRTEFEAGGTKLGAADKAAREAPSPGPVTVATGAAMPAAASVPPAAAAPAAAAAAGTAAAATATGFNIPQENKDTGSGFLNKQQVANAEAEPSSELQITDAVPAKLPSGQVPTGNAASLMATGNAKVQAEMPPPLPTNTEGMGDEEQDTGLPELQVGEYKVNKNKFAQPSTNYT